MKKCVLAASLLVFFLAGCDYWSLSDKQPGVDGDELDIPTDSPDEDAVDIDDGFDPEDDGLPEVEDDTSTDGDDTPDVEPDIDDVIEIDNDIDVIDGDEGLDHEYIISDGFIFIPAGRFWMGSPSGCPGPSGYPGNCELELGRGADEGLHEVTLTHDFEMMQLEVSQTNFYNVSGHKPSEFSQKYGNGYPVETVTWFDAVVYCNQLSARSFYPQCYTINNIECKDDSENDPDSDMCKLRGGVGYASVGISESYDKIYDCPGYRLPTEAEWEYAARAGSLTALYTGENTVGNNCEEDVNLIPLAWYCYHKSSNGETTYQGGLKQPNGFNLYDMLGNVREWIWDRHGEYPEVVGSLINPVDESSGNKRIWRGGSYVNGVLECRCAFRDSMFPDNAASDMGFRVVRSLY